MKTDVLLNFAIFFLSILATCSCQSNEKDKPHESATSLDTTSGVVKIDLNRSEVNFRPHFKDMISRKSIWPSLSPSGSVQLKRIISGLDTVLIDSKVFYVLEGDLVLDSEELEEYLKSQLEEDKNHVMFVKPSLIILASGRDTLKLKNPGSVKFAIIKSSFSTAEYDTLVKAFDMAITDWKNTCNVIFSHEKDLDAQLNFHDHPNDLFFVVRKYNSNGKFEAKAPFPHYKKENRKVLIDPAYFSSIYNKPGIIRHELGHVMGFLHEHVRSGAPKSCPKGILDSHFQLSDYDPKSVMHYYCKVQSFGTTDLKITEVDRKSSLKVYPF